MPPKTTCSVCNQSVLKSTTRHIGNGKRACKTHDGIMGIATEVQSVYEDKLKVSRKPIGPSNRSDFSEYIANPSFCCSICRCTCMHVSDMMLEAAIVSRELHASGSPINILTNPEAVANLVATRCKKKPAYVYTRDELNDTQWDMVVATDFAASMVGIAAVCLTCVKAKQFPDKSAPPITFDQLVSFSSIAETVLDGIIEERKS